VTKTELLFSVQDRSGMDNDDNTARAVDIVLDTLGFSFTDDEEIHPLNHLNDSVQEYSDPKSLYSHIQDELDMEGINVNAERLTKAVLHYLKESLDTHEIEEFTTQFPEDIAIVWLVA
jgi:uncharacterized protein (DUF2267 family)